MILYKDKNEETVAQTDEGEKKTVKADEKLRRKRRKNRKAVCAGGDCKPDEGKSSEIGVYQR